MEIASRNGKLNTGMTLESVTNATYKNEKAKNKTISLFSRVDKNNDCKLDEDEIKAYDRKQTWKTVGLVTGSLLIAGATIALARGNAAKGISEATKVVDDVVATKSDDVVDLVQTASTKNITEAAKVVKGKQALSYNDVVDYLQGRRNFDDVDAVYDIVNNRPEIVSRITGVTKPDGRFLDEYEVLYSVIDRQHSVLSTKPEKVFAILENSDEMMHIVRKDHVLDSIRLEKAIKHPLESTRVLHPDLFEPEAVVNFASVRDAAEKMYHRNYDSSFRKGISVIDDNPALVEKMVSMKTSSGRVLFTSEDIAGFFCNSSGHFRDQEMVDKIMKVLDNPKYVDMIEGYRSSGFGLWALLFH